MKALKGDKVGFKMNVDKRTPVMLILPALRL